MIETERGASEMLPRAVLHIFVADNFENEMTETVPILITEEPEIAKPQQQQKRSAAVLEQTKQPKRVKLTAEEKQLKEAAIRQLKEMGKALKKSMVTENNGYPQTCRTTAVNISFEMLRAMFPTAAAKNPALFNQDKKAKQFEFEEEGNPDDVFHLQMKKPSREGGWEVIRELTVKYTPSSANLAIRADVEFEVDMSR